jgi:hypothetical protein
MHVFAGLKINVQPSVITAKRSWGERILSWPWRPWVATVDVPNPLFTNGKCYQVGDTLLITDVQFDALRRGVAHDAGLLDREPTRFDI